MEDFASVDHLTDIFNSFDLDALITETSSTSNRPSKEVAKSVRPLFLATMRPTRRKGPDVDDAAFGVIQEDILFNDDPTIKGKKEKKKKNLFVFLGFFS